ncbi:MAG: transcription-repair coupling factor [Christensenellales bacterium]
MSSQLLSFTHGTRCEELLQALQQKGVYLAYGVVDAYKAYLAAKITQRYEQPTLYVTVSDQKALDTAQALRAYGVDTLYFPSRDLRVHGDSVKSGDYTAARAAALCRIGQCRAVVTSVAALLPPLVPPGVFRQACIDLHPGSKLSMQELIASLIRAGYARFPITESEGQFSVRGGILDVCAHGVQPLRIEYWGDEIDSLRSFDMDTQRSTGPLQRAFIPPATEAPLQKNGLKRLMEALSHTHYDLNAIRRTGFFENAEQFVNICYGKKYSLAEYMQEPVVLFDEPQNIKNRSETLRQEFLDSLKIQLANGTALSQQRHLLYAYEELAQTMAGPLVLLQSLKANPSIRTRQTFSFSTQHTPHYRGNFRALADDVQHYARENARMRTVICAPDSEKAARISKELFELGADIPFLETIGDAPACVLQSRLRNGFYSPNDALAFIGEDALAVARKTASGRMSRSKISPFVELEPGDVVVHDQYGVGRYAGVQKVEIDDTWHDYMVVEYAAGDLLKVPFDQMHRVQKYIGAQESVPRLNRLGGKDWLRTKERVSRSLKELAFDLSALYAQRHTQTGFAFSPDTPFQRQFEESFPYEETPDQLVCIDEIKRDMESTRVMDRLLCGDVGYGKTEVALRAAFKAVMDSKQVCFLAPTTILAQQHYHTIAQRFEGFPIRFALLTRFTKPQALKQTLGALKAGELDIVVGTHKLLSKDIHFKDLGLLIVDEEQRFGVSHKETIKQMKKNVDVLSLSATPIPRTLHMSLNGIRDMSLIETPPEQRYPVQTYVMEYEKDVVHDAITREINRGGQVYYVYNRVRSIEEFKARLQQIVPQADIVIAHGQMGEAQLEDAMLRFYEGEHDVLLCSTIIESGIDIANVNTLIVHDADRFGLSQLYQLRGRVGRGDRLAYAYFMFHPEKSISEVAQKRLSSIRDFTEFGSGFKIAMRDLEIRGAGNILGPEQHGHMSEVGYELYCRMMEEAVRAIDGHEATPSVDTLIDARIDAHIPSDYISDEAVRIDAYRRIAAIQTKSDLSDVWEELEDRFAPPPDCVQNLLLIALAKAYASHCGISNLSIQDKKIQMRFVDHLNFNIEKLLSLIQSEPGAAFNGAMNTVIQIRQNKPASDMLDVVIAFLEKLSDCKE